MLILHSLCHYPAYIPSQFRTKCNLSNLFIRRLHRGGGQAILGQVVYYHKHIYPPICYPATHYRPHTSAYPPPSPSDSSQQPNGARPSTPLLTNSIDLSRNSRSHSLHDSSSMSCTNPGLESYAELRAENVGAAMRVVISGVY